MDKVCKQCFVIKPSIEFTKCSQCVTGYRNICKQCTRLNHKEYRANPNYKMNKTEYANKHIEKYKEYQKVYKDTEVGKDNRCKWYEKNKHLLEKKPHRKEYRRKYNKTSISLKWRLFLHNTLRRVGKGKEGHTIDMLGYSVLDLKQHLEQQFTEGMTWANYGEWHIDHKKPLSKFPPETSICEINSLDNLQPLWATTKIINGTIYIGNINKSNKL